MWAADIGLDQGGFQRRARTAGRRVSRAGGWCLPQPLRAGGWRLPARSAI